MLKNRLRNKYILWILYPLAFFYWVIIYFRNLFYEYGVFKAQKLSCSVISVGNLTVGGTGKTILVIYLARLLQKKNKKVAILTRGYGRIKKGAFLATDGKSAPNELTPYHCGDEPFLMSQILRGVPIMIDKNRFRGGLNLINKFHPDVILLDDGFQHRSLFRDLDIVLLNAQDKKNDHKILPIGLLREPWKNITRSDLIIITKYNLRSDTPYFLKKLEQKNRPIIKAKLESKLSSLNNQTEKRFKELIKNFGFLFAGIGDTKSLMKSVESLGIKILGYKFFNDHHQYNETDLKTINDSANKVDAKFLITTEKDWVKTKNFKNNYPVVVLSANFKIEPGNKLNRFIDQII